MVTYHQKGYQNHQILLITRESMVGVGVESTSVMSFNLTLSFFRYSGTISLAKRVGLEPGVINKFEKGY